MTPLEPATVPVPADLFIGLVTHPRSRFPEARTPEGLAARIVSRARSHGLAVETEVVDDDLLTDDRIRIDRQAVSASISAELSTELRWHAYLTGRPATFVDRAVMSARETSRRLRFAPPWRRRLEPDAPGVRMVRRLANIELAHLAIMKAAVASHARWAVILEDDAESSDPERFTDDLLQFISAADRSGEPAMMNLSESFSIDQLGIGHLLAERTNQDQPPTWRTMSASRIVTNTVCAVLYRRGALKVLFDATQSIPLAPVIPIDFKLNSAIMRLSKNAASFPCWVVSPAPLTQASGVPAVRRLGG